MDKFTRFDLIEESVKKAQEGKEVYLNLYPSEIRKIQKRYPDLYVEQKEIVNESNKRRKIWCCLKAK